MTELIRTRRTRPAPPSRRVRLSTRLLLVLGVLVGLFAMHGLSADHDLTMTGAHGTAGGVMEMTGQQPAVAAEHTTPAPAPASDPVSDMAQACLAVLTGVAAVALLLVGALRLLPSHRRDVRPPLWRAHSRARPPARPPDLNVLCVLRT